MKKIVRLTENDLIRLVKKVIEEQSVGYNNYSGEDVKKLLSSKGFKPLNTSTYSWVLYKGEQPTKSDGFKIDRGKYRAEQVLGGGDIFLYDFVKGQVVRIPDSFSSGKTYQISYGTVDKNGKIGNFKTAKLFGSNIWFLCNAFGVEGAQDLFTKISQSAAK